MNRIQIVLDRLNMSQTDLAFLIEKSYKVVNKYCSNGQQPPVKVLFRIADVLKVPASELLNDEYKDRSYSIKRVDFSK